MSDEIPKVWDGGEPWDPREYYTQLVLHIQSLLADGEQRTARDIYYALESRGYDYPYDDVKRAVKRGRTAGYVNPHQIVDTSRRAPWTVTDGEISVRWDNRTIRYEGPDEFLVNVADGLDGIYFENFWKEQDCYVEVWLEKAALASVFTPIVREWNVRLETTRGDWSHSKIFRATQRLIGKLDDGKDVRILYFGDFNPSGLHAPVTVQESMGKYGLQFRESVDSTRPMFFDIWPRNGPIRVGDGGTLQFERVALNLKHIRRYDLPENPNPSKTNKDQVLRNRFMKYASEGLDVNIELNALKEFHRDEFEDMIRDAIRQHVDVDAKEAFEQRVSAAREDLNDAIHVDPNALGGDT